MMSDATYQKFSDSLQPIFSELAVFSEALSKALASPGEVAGLPDFIHQMIAWQHTSYPEWVFKSGFNRHFRGGFRYILVHLNEVLEAFLSLDYHLRHFGDLDLLQDISGPLAATININRALLEVIASFFAGKVVDQSGNNLTSDITDLQNAGRLVLPHSLELMDINPDHLHLAAIIKDVVDIREILLKLLTALPIGDLAVTE